MATMEKVNLKRTFWTVLWFLTMAFVLAIVFAFLHNWQTSSELEAAARTPGPLHCCQNL